MDKDFVIRKAAKTDSRKIAELFRISSDGVADYIWGRLAGPGEGLIEVGARRYARKDTAFSYQNCVLAERDGRVAGMLHSYVMPEPAEDDDEAPDPVLAPYGELEVPGSLYISSLAVFPELRGEGIGTRLLSIARDRARELGAKELSLIVLEQKQEVVRLYLRQGYSVVDRRAIVPHELIPYTGDAVLMTAAV